MRNCQPTFQSDCTILHSHQQCMRILISPYNHEYMLLFVFFILAIPVVVKWYLIVVLICISLMANDVEHLFMYLLAICIFSLKKCLFRSFDHFSIRIFVFLVDLLYSSISLSISIVQDTIMFHLNHYISILINLAVSTLAPFQSIPHTASRQIFLKYNLIASLLYLIPFYSFPACLWTESPNPSHSLQGPE